MYDMLTKRLHREQGFTLIELVVVLFILGLLIAVALPSYNQARQTAARDEARVLGQEWRTLEWACWLTVNVVSSTISGNACNSDGNIGFSEFGTNWNFNATTLQGGASVYFISPTTGQGANIQVIRCAPARTGTNVAGQQYDNYLTVSGTATDLNGVTKNVGAGYDSFVTAAATATCP